MQGVRGVVGVLLVLAVVVILAAGGIGQAADVMGVTTFTGLAVSPAAVQVVTADAVIRAVGSNQPISSTAAVGTSHIQTGTLTTGAYPTVTVMAPTVPRGQLLLLHNVGAYTITITDTGTTRLAGNAELGQYDTLLLQWDGTNWLQVSKADNQAGP
jgi:hypothetical protein